LKPSLSKLTAIFFRIGNTTFGGGYVTIGMLGRELIDTRGWLSSEKFDLAFALSRVTPGTNLLAFCAAVGSQLRGWMGALAAVLAVTLPSALIALLFIYGFELGQTNRYAMAAIGGTVAAVAGMMWSTIWTILRPQVGGLVRNLQVLVIVGGAFVASWKFGVTPLPVIGAGLLIGLLWKDPGRAK
jgi:chromate transporter